MKREEEIQIIRLQDEQYPPLLREIYDPPKHLYVRGNMQVLQHEYLFAVVGSRKANAYGQQVCTALLPRLAAAGMPLVSGLAFGIDSLAHKACVEQERPTVAVLGSGIDDASIYPRSHVRLGHAILDTGGALISEYEPGTKPHKYYFPARNRIIAGLCKATLIVQASERSGSLITARLALESNREVFAVPGNITDPLSAGTNRLIQQGAAPAVSADDILAIYGIMSAAPAAAAAALTEDQSRLLDRLTYEPKHIDEIIGLSQLPPQAVSILLVEMEMLNAVEHVGGMKYVRK